MTEAPLCVIQARLHSTRLHRKMLLRIGDHSALWWAWAPAVKFFGEENVVIASPADDIGTLQSAVPDATFFGFDGDVDDVLGRFHACAHRWRDDPLTPICRVTPDDWPVDLLRETFSLRQLDHLHATVHDFHLRQHIGRILPGRVELNTHDDYLAIRKQLAER